MKNPTPWHIDPQAIYLISDANGEQVYMSIQNAALIVDAVNAYVAASQQLTILDGEQSGGWQTQAFNRHQEATIDGECITISQWLNRIRAIEVQWLRSGDGYDVLARGW